MALKSHCIAAVSRRLLFSVCICAMVSITPFDSTFAQETPPPSHTGEIVFGGGFIFPVHPEDYADAVTGIGIEGRAGMGLVMTGSITMTGTASIGYMPSGFTFEPAVVDTCPDQYKYENLFLFWGMGDLRFYLAPERGQKIRSYILAGAGLLNARQKVTFTSREYRFLRCDILDGYEEVLSKWSLAVNGGLGVELAIKDRDFKLHVQAKYFWISGAIYKNMNNIIIEMTASIPL